VIIKELRDSLVDITTPEELKKKVRLFGLSRNENF
jgi:hypothetical protein